MAHKDGMKPYSHQLVKPYDAMVYIDGGRVYAVDSMGEVIAKGVAGTDDATVIQEAIDSLGSAGGVVRLLPGEYYVDTDIYVKENIVFSGSGNQTTTITNVAASYKQIYVYNQNNTTISDMRLYDDLVIRVRSSTQNVVGSTIRNIVVERNRTRYGIYIGMDADTDVSDVLIENCVVKDGAWGYLIHRGNAGSGKFKHITLQNCSAINCGRDYRFCPYDVGFSLESGDCEGVRIIGCHAEGCLESGFHQEVAPERESVVYVGCTSKDNGQKTKESRTIVDRNDLTQTTPFVCTHTPYGKTHSEVSKIRCRLKSDTDSITAFSVRIQGLTSGDVPIDETITESTPGVTNESDGWSFYTTATFKILSTPTITVNSVTGAVAGDNICVGQDGTYVAGFLAGKSSYIGCTTQDEVRGFYVITTDAHIIGCSDTDSITPKTGGGHNGTIVDGFRKRVSGQNVRNVITVSATDGDYSTLASAFNSIADAAEDNPYTIIVKGYIAETSAIDAKSYVNVIGLGKATISATNVNGSYFINVNGKIHATWYGLNIIWPSSSGNTKYVFNITNSTDKTFVIDSCNIINECTGIYSHGLYLENVTGLTVRNCNIIASQNSNAWYSNGIKFESSLSGDVNIENTYILGGGGGHGYAVVTNIKYVTFTNCIIEGGTGTSITYGGYNHAVVWSGGRGIFKSCIIKGGYKNISYGLLYNGRDGDVKLIGCEIINGTKNTGNRAIAIGAAENRLGNLTLVGCSIKYPTFDGSVTYEGSSYEILPFADCPYFIEQIRVSVTTAGAPGSVINIGTTDGGNEIASVPSDSTGNKWFRFTHSQLASNVPFYAKPTDTSTRFSVSYIVGENNSACRGIDIYGIATPNVIISNTLIETNMVSSGLFAATALARPYQFKVTGCTFTSKSPTAYSIQFETAGYGTDVPVYGCYLGGPTNVVSFAPNSNNYGPGAIIPALIRPDITQVLEVMGTPRLLSPFMEDTGTSITDYTRLSNTLTAQASVDTWYGFQGRTKYYDFDGSAKYLYRTNDTDFDFGNATTDSAFSVVCCLNPDAVDTRFLIGKWDENNLREWRLFLDASGYPTFQLYDESADTYIGRVDSASFGTGTWKVLIATYDGSGISAGCKLYIDGVQVDDADYASGTYVAMEAVSAYLMVGAKKNSTTYSEYYDGKMTWIGIAAKELSADEVWSLTQRLKGVLGV